MREREIRNSLDNIAMSGGKPDECERLGCSKEAKVLINPQPPDQGGLYEEAPEIDASASTYVCENCDIEFADRVSLEGGMSVTEFLNDEKTEEWDGIGE
jgi:hypothetical protein